MNDIMGNLLKIGDTVATSAYGSQISVFTVVGFTRQKVRLVDREDYTILKNPVAVVLVVIPEEKD